MSPIQPSYVTTTIRGRFDHYEIENYLAKNGQVYLQFHVILTNCEDLQTKRSFGKLSFNLTKSFKQLGLINDHPILDVDCRHYLEDDTYNYPTNVTIARKYNTFATDSNEIKQQLLGLHTTTEI